MPVSRRPRACRLPTRSHYATRFSPNGQISTLNLGTVAGFGKLFSTGGQLLMGFANEVMFNFAGKNPQQPTVISALPISFVQPLLRGGGRAVTLEPLTQAERNLLYAVRAFGLFRQQFFVVTLTGGTIQNFGNRLSLWPGSPSAGNTDPTIGFLPVVFNLVEIEVDRRNLLFLESVAKLYQELIQGEASGLSQLAGRPGDAARDRGPSSAVHRQDNLPLLSLTNSRCR